MEYFDEQKLLDECLLIGETVTDYPRIWPRDGATNWTANTSQMSQYGSHTMWTPHENALGLSGIHRPEPGWFADQLAPQHRTSVQDHWQNDTHFSSVPPLHQTNPVVQTSQPPVFNYAPVLAEAISVGTEETRNPRHIQENHIGQKPISRSLDRHMSAPGPLPRSSTAVRSCHTPYPLGTDSTRRDAMFASSYLCHWSDGVGPCGAEVAGTKSAIGEHLQTVHAVRFKANKVPQVCHWQGCERSMRRESIVRHILAVHMKDKVHCPNCRSQFARPDSLQRHQRARLAMGVCKTGKRTRSS